MKKTKNNTCACCGEHIDKSDIQEAWVTVTRSSFWLNCLDSKGEPQEQFVKGWRKTFCIVCAGDNKILEGIYNKKREQEDKNEEVQL